MKTLLFSLCLILSSLGAVAVQGQTTPLESQSEKAAVFAMLEQFHAMAREAKFEAYFDLFAPESEFIGTDALETWDKAAFMAYAKPHFDKGRGWDYKAISRSITLSSNARLGWFSEILDSHYGLCRGSGVVEKIDGKWKLRQYVLSFTVPNSVSEQVLKIKLPAEALQKEKLK